MGQESFIYSFVARGTMVLAEFTEFTGNFPAIATQCLQKLPSSNNKFTYNCDHHTFNFLVEDGYGKFVTFLPDLFVFAAFYRETNMGFGSIAGGIGWIWTLFGKVSVFT